MTAKEHGRLLGIFFLVQAGLQLFGGIIAVVIYGGMGTMILANARRDEDQFMGGLFIVMSIVMVLLVAVFGALYAFGGWKLFKEKPHSKVLPIIISCLSILGFPLGTALGVYGLWFTLGDKGKEYYDGAYNQGSGMQPPPPPNSWQQ